MEKVNIAIDGPGGSGKSTIAKLLSKELNYIYVDTGAMYRSVALYCILNNINFENKEEVTRAMKNIDIQLKYKDGTQIILLNGKDVSSRIREQDVANASSKVATIEKVRNVLVAMQKDIGRKNNVVMDGRDIGSNVLKHSKNKFYLDASVLKRAERRSSELLEKGIVTNIETIKNEINERDERDKNRDISPLIQTDDAIYIDTTEMNIKEVLQVIIKNIKK